MTFPFAAFCPDRLREAACCLPMMTVFCTLLYMHVGLPARHRRVTSEPACLHLSAGDLPDVHAAVLVKSGTKENEIDPSMGTSRYQVMAVLLLKVGIVINGLTVLRVGRCLM